MIKAIIKITAFFLFILQPAVWLKKIRHLTNFSGQIQIYVKLTNTHKRLSLQAANSHIFHAKVGVAGNLTKFISLHKKELHTLSSKKFLQPSMCHGPQFSSLMSVLNSKFYVQVWPSVEALLLFLCVSLDSFVLCSLLCYSSSIAIQCDGLYLNVQQCNFPQSFSNLFLSLIFLLASVMSGVILLDSVQYFSFIYFSFYIESYFYFMPYTNSTFSFVTVDCLHLCLTP